jgi:elongation factor Ts
MANYTIDDIKLLRDKTSAGMGLCKEALEAADGDMKKAIEYVNDRSDVVSRLHNMTGAKIGLCKIAFEDSGKDFEKAVEIIKERGWAGEGSSNLAEGPKVKDGVLGVYVHGTDHKTVGLAEVTCMTDFVARNEMFRNFAHEVAMQVAAMKPEYASRDQVPQEKKDEMKALFEKELEQEGKPQNLWEKIMDGKFNKFYQEKCLLEQRWFKDDSKLMQALLDEAIQQLGEPITIRRVLVWRLGE